MNKTVLLHIRETMNMNNQTINMNNQTKSINMNNLNFATYEQP